MIRQALFVLLLIVALIGIMAAGVSSLEWGIAGAAAASQKQSIELTMLTWQGCSNSDWMLKSSEVDTSTPLLTRQIWKVTALIKNCEDEQVETALQDLRRMDGYRKHSHAHCISLEYVKRFDDATAEKWFEELIQDPDALVARHFYACHLDRLKKDMSKIDEMMTYCISRNPSTMSQYHLLATAQERQGFNNDAVLTAEKCLVTFPYENEAPGEIVAMRELIQRLSD